MSSLDPRLHAYRADLAALPLRGKVESARFVAGARARIGRGVIDLRRAPAKDAPLDSQLLYGESVLCYERKDGWAWVQNECDGYVGYVAADSLIETGSGPSHRVAVLHSFVYPEPDLKSAVLDSLPMTAAVAVTRERNGFSALPDGGWVFSRHLEPLDSVTPDYVATAQAFLGTPYLWGGRSSIGLDCSALIQLALARAGIAAPRDSDQQAESLGDLVSESLPSSGLRRGDLVFMPGHIAIAMNETEVLHANAGAMLVTVEPLRAVQERLGREYGRPPEAMIDMVRRPVAQS